LCYKLLPLSCERQKKRAQFEKRATNIFKKGQTIY
jgi:hypothetical protein